MCHAYNTRADIRTLMLIACHIWCNILTATPGIATRTLISHLCKMTLRQDLLFALVTLCVDRSSVTCGFPSQMASNKGQIVLFCIAWQSFGHTSHVAGEMRCLTSHVKSRYLIPSHDVMMMMMLMMSTLNKTKITEIRDAVFDTSDQINNWLMINSIQLDIAIWNQDSLCIQFLEYHRVRDTRGVLIRLYQSRLQRVFHELI